MAKKGYYNEDGEWVDPNKGHGNDPDHCDEDNPASDCYKGVKDDEVEWEGPIPETPYLPQVTGEDETELKNLINFARGLIFKNTYKAELAETLESSKAAYNLISAILEIPPFEGNKWCTTRAEIKAVYRETNTYYIDYLKRIKYIDDDGKLLVSQNTMIEEIIKIRVADDHDIVWSVEGILYAKHARVFIQFFKENLRYYNTVLHSEGFAQYTRYWNYVNYVVTLMTFERMINHKIVGIYDIDLFTERDVRNMFASYGLDFFEEIPMKFRKRLLKSLNHLLQYKGTTTAIVSIVQLFGFENINIFKYYLVKDFEREEYGVLKNVHEDRAPLVPILKFARVDYHETNLEKAFLDEDTGFVGYDDFVSSDPFWHASQEEAAAEEFNYVNTKYLGIDVTIDMMRSSLNYALLYNYLLKFKKAGNVGYSALTLFNSTISTERLHLVDLMVALHALALKIMGYEDKIVHDFDTIAWLKDSKPYIHDFNSGPDYDVVSDAKYDMEITGIYEDDSLIYFPTSGPVEYEIIPVGQWNYAEHLADGDMTWREYKDNREVRMYGEFNMWNPNLSFEENLDRTLGYTTFEGLKTGREIDERKRGENTLWWKKEVEDSGPSIDTLFESFRENLEYMEDFRELIQNENDYSKYQEYQKLWDAKFTQLATKDVFEGYETYMDWLEVESPDLWKYINLIDADLETGNEDVFFEIYSMVEGFIDSSNELDNYDIVSNNSIIFEYIRRFIHTLINIFKAYTIQLRDFNIYYTYKDPTEEAVRLREETFTHGHLLRRSDGSKDDRFYLTLDDEYDFSVMFAKKEPLVIRDVYNRLVKFTFEGNIDLTDQIVSVQALLKFCDGSSLDTHILKLDDKILLVSNTEHKDVLVFRDTHKKSSTYSFEGYLNIKDEITKITKRLTFTEKVSSNDKNFILGTNSNIKRKDISLVRNVLGRIISILDGHVPYNDLGIEVLPTVPSASINVNDINRRLGKKAVRNCIVLRDYFNITVIENE